MTGARIPANGVMLNCYQAGEGPDIILVHGLAANLAFWYLNIIPALSRNFRVTAFDLRGHGYSDMPPSGYTSAEMAHDVRGLLDHLEIARAHLVGHSFGGAVALHCAALFPERVKTVTVADGRIRSLQPSQKMVDWPFWERWKAVLDDLEMDVDGDQELDFTLLEKLARRTLQKRVRAAGANDMFLPFGGWNGGARNARAWLRLLDTTDAREEFRSSERLTLATLRAIRRPVFAIYGEYSFCLPSLYGLQSNLNDCETKIVRGAGHYHPVIQSEVFTEALSAFLRVHEERAAGRGGAPREDALHA